MIKKTFLLVFIAISTQLLSQSKQKRYHHSISSTITSLIANQIKIDYEYFGIKNSKYSPTISFFNGSLSRKNYKEQDLDIKRQSFGVEIGSKFYVSDDFMNRKYGNRLLYFNPAIRYQRHNFSYQGEAWIKFTENGTELYKLEKDVFLTPHSNRIAFAPQMGFITTKNRFFTDFYFGASVFKDFIKNNLGQDELPLNGWGNRLKRTTLFAGYKLGIVF